MTGCLVSLMGCTQLSRREFADVKLNMDEYAHYTCLNQCLREHVRGWNKNLRLSRDKYIDFPVKGRTENQPVPFENASWVLSLPRGEVPNGSSAESGALPSLCKPGDGRSLLHQTTADALSGLLLLIKKKLRKNVHFLHKADPAFTKSSKMEKPNFQLKNCFDGYFQEAVDRNVVWTWWKQDALFAFVTPLETFTVLLTEKLHRTREKEELFVNILFSQTWAL